MIYTPEMRRLLAILLVTLFLLPTAMPLFALGAGPDAGLPACCRRNGKHHCMMSMEMMQAMMAGTQLHAIPMKCPLFPRALNTAQHNELSTRAAALIFAELVAHPALYMQTEARARVALFCARQKRGPPTLLS